MGMTAELDLIVNAAVTGAAQHWPGGKAAFSVAGTFAGATVKLQILGPDGATFLDVATASFTAAGYVIVDLPVGSLKAVVTGGAPSGIYATVQRVTESI